MTSPARPEARAAVLTPAGRGAVAVVRLWGPGAKAVANAAFRPARGGPLAGTPPGRLRLGRVGAGRGDEVVAVIREGDPPEVEIHTHGGPAPLGLVLEALEAAGAAITRPEDWVAHASAGPLEAAAAEDLARAPTVRVAEILLDQAGGALSAAVRRGIGAGPAELAAGLDRLIARAGFGERLLRGWSVVLAGRPNVGKSRLLNALSGYERAIVAPTPGTTRDVVTVRTALDGWPVELADTAGLREASDAVEAAGIARARADQAAADLVLLVLDRSEPLTAADFALIAAHPGALVVASKADLPPAWEAPEAGALAVSAVQGDGLEALIAAVARRVAPDPPPPGAAVPFRPAIARRLRRARHLLAGGRPEPARRALLRLLSRGPAC